MPARDPSDQVRVIAAGHAHPSTVITNDDLVRSIPDLEDGWAEKVLGIDTRHVLGPHERLSDLATDALDQALARADWEPDSVDLLICGTSFVDDILPATSSIICRDRCPSAVAFDVNAACASGLYALNVARLVMSGDKAISRAAVVAAERPTAWADYRRRDSSVFWGDAAACLLIDRSSSKPGFEILSTSWRNDNNYPEKVHVPRAGTFSHDGRYSYQQVVRLSGLCVEDALTQAGVSAGQVARLVGHQSNPRLLSDLSAHLGIPIGQQWSNVTWAGNQGAAGVVAAFADGWTRDAGDLHDGDHVVMVAVGGGYAASAALLRWRG